MMTRVCCSIRRPVLLLVVLTGLTGRSFSQITSPEMFFGFTPGADRQLVRWDRAVDYFRLLERESDRLRVLDMGPSTMGNPFIVLLISAPGNLADLERLQRINRKIGDPRGVDSLTIREYIREGKAVICQSMGLHSSEVGGTQSTPNITYRLLSQNDETTLRILDNVLFFMIPCFNPDGDIMIHDWYYETLGTPFEGAGMPWLYHKYIGHDTNRDGDFLNMVESRYAASILYVDWPPQAYIDHHQMGSYGPRFFVPPYCDPIRPWADPLIWREISWYGSHIAYKLEENGVQGVINGAMFPGWGHFGWHWITPFHNIAGMLTESASARLASPLYIHPDQLKAGSRQFPEYEAQSTFPSPWPGGWWRLSDIVRQKEIAAVALLDLAARNRETVLYNAWQKALHQIERGRTGDVNAVIVPADQHDPLTALKMINILLRSGIEIQRADGPFQAGDRLFGEGSFLIPLAQPKTGLIRNLLMETHYADNEWTRGDDGSVLEPYDLSTHTMHEFMGVSVLPVKLPPERSFPVLTEQVSPSGSLPERIAGAAVLDCRFNDSYRAVNLLLNRGVDIYRAGAASGTVPAGAFLVDAGRREDLRAVAAETGLPMSGTDTVPKRAGTPLKRLRTGIYQRYYGGNIDEGWTRFLLEQFDFPFEIVRDDVFRKKGRLGDFDAVIFASDRDYLITGKLPEDAARWIDNELPEKYRSGIGDEGVEQLKQFVRDGGRVITLGDSWKLAVEAFDLKIKNVLEGIDRNAFFCSGSTLNASFAAADPLARGMPDQGVVLFTDSPVFEIVPGMHNEDYTTIVRYADSDLLKSGWLIGEKYIAGKPAMIRAEYGKGDIILIGFRAQHRAQTHGTFKLLFNALVK
ncbi:peptidase M14 family protein [bacterium]|nr:peptidase M14 family protein [bacterium]